MNHFAFSIDNVSLIAVSTGDKIYIFDLFTLDVDKTIGEFKRILDNDAQLKIVFDARNIVNNFKLKFQFTLKPVFDVMLAAAQFYESESVVSMKNIVKTVLGVDVEVEEDNGLSTRPISNELLHSFVLRSAYLVPIYHKLAAKGFSFAFSKHSVQPEDKPRDFFDSLSNTQKLCMSTESKGIREVDFSIYEEF
jgi:ribonuclease D